MLIYTTKQTFSSNFRLKNLVRPQKRIGRAVRNGNDTIYTLPALIFENTSLSQSFIDVSRDNTDIFFMIVVWIDISMQKKIVVFIQTTMN